MSAAPRRRRFKSAGAGWRWRASDEPLPPGGPFVTAPGLRPPETAPLFPDRPAATFTLPVRDAPSVPRDAPAAPWVDPRDHGGDPADGANADRPEQFAAQDDTAAVQAAVQAAVDACPDGGTVFLSGGAWVIEGEALVRGGVRRVVGTNARMPGGGRFVVTDSGSAVAARPDGPIEFADLETHGVSLRHASAGTPVVRHCDFGLLTNAASPFGGPAGPIFLEDYIGWLRLDGRTAWARQFTPRASAARTSSTTAGGCGFWGMRPNGPTPRSSAPPPGPSRNCSACSPTSTTARPACRGTSRRTPR